MASKGVIVVVSGQDDTGKLFAAIDQHMSEMRTKAEETSSSLGKMGNFLLHGIAIAGIYKTAEDFKHLAESAVETGVSLGHLSQQTGVSVQNLSVLRYASQQTGIEFETLTKGFKKLSTGINKWENGSKEAGKTFTALKISQSDLKDTGGDMYKILGLVADRFKNMPDGINKNAAATQLFGRAGQQLIPVLNEGAEGIEKYKAEAQSLGLILDAKGVKKMEDLHKASVEAKGAMEGLALSLAGTLAPAFQTAALGASTLLEKLHQLTLGAAGQDVPAFAWMTRADQVHRAAEMMKSIPDELAGASNPSALAGDAASKKKKLEDDLSQLEEHYKKKQISDSAYLKQKTQIQNQWNHMDLRQNQSYFSALEDQVARAQQQVEKDQASHLEASMDTFDIQKKHKDQLAALMEQERTTMDRIDTAKGKVAAANPPKSGLDFHLSDEEKNKIEEARHQLAEANRKLADEAAKVEEARQKQVNEGALAVLEGAHKLMLISDAQYYAQKKVLTESSFAAERTAIEKQVADAKRQYATLEHQPAATTADQIEKQARLTTLRASELQLEEKILDLQGKQKASEIDIQTAIDESIKARAKSILQMESELEEASKSSGAGSALALQRNNAGQQRQDLQNGGATPQQLVEFDALQKIKEQQIQVTALDRQREAIALEAGIQQNRIDQDELSRSISKEEAQKRRAQAQEQELSKLRELSNAYAQYGEAGKKAAADVQQEMTTTMRSIQSEANYAVQDTAEKFAHGIFDPLFQMSGDWKRTWQAMSQNMMRDTGSMLEKQMFKTMFGPIDPRMGTAGGNPGSLITAMPTGSGHNGISSGAEKVVGSILGLFGKKRGNATTSNGGLGAGAGTVATDAASLMQMGKSGSDGGGVQVTLINQGQPMQVSQTSQSSDGGEQHVVQIVLKQLENNGPIAQGIQGMMGGL
jgi:DNA-binding Xre family transcriptional regulator